MKIEKVRAEDLGTVLEIYAYAREQMRKNGNPSQWGTSRPPVGRTVMDIEEGKLYGEVEDSRITGVFFFYVGNDPTYDEIDGEWIDGGEYGVIHRIAGAEGSRGVLKTALDFCEKRVRSIRIDTHENNVIMRHLLTKYGYTECGVIITDDGTPRIAFQKVTES